MRNLKYAILGLLIKKPMTGYDITKEFNNGLIEFWSAKHSQIYPELNKLYKEKLIDYKVEISGDILEKKVYSITAEGKADFLDWLSQDAIINPTPKDIFRLRMFFSNYMDIGQVIELLDSQIKQHQKKLNHLKDTNTHFKDIPGIGTSESGDYLVLQGAIMRETNYLQWLELCKKYYEERR